MNERDQFKVQQLRNERDQLMQQLGANAVLLQLAEAGQLPDPTPADELSAEDVTDV